MNTQNEMKLNDLTTSGAEFIVYYVKRAKDKFYVAGRCGDSWIQVGNIFTSVYRYTPAISLEDYGKVGERINIKPVHLRIEAIENYNEDRSELAPGWTAQLTLAGDGGKYIGKRDVLGFSSYPTAP